MYNSQYYTCEQVDERLLQGYVDDFNEVNSTNYSKEDLLLKLFQAINWDQVFGKYKENPEFVIVYLDATKRVLWGIKADGSMYWSKGVPDVIKDFITKKLEENLLAIEFEDNGDIAAYYGEEGNIEDVYMDDNGDLIIEQVINAD